MDEIDIPAIGRHVRVKTRYKLAWMNEYPHRPVEGFVARLGTLDPPGSIRLCPATTYLGESVIDIDHIVSIEYLDSGEHIRPVTLYEPRGEPASDKEADFQSWPVEGSKGAMYTVIKRGSQWSCDCIAGGFGRTCKHIKKIVDETSSG